ncbi:MAG TPA: PDZ domain-containing protein [Candidatus Polarisedimenticolia bacterium]|nr:PDZ domain-containing protein [Candidatus Polarisedimenticolia bacterium]
MGLPLLALAGTPEQFATCPRCGYSCEVGWRYCPACGWDLRRLAGPEGAATLHGIGTSVVGLSLVQEPPRLEEILPPSFYSLAQRNAYLFHAERRKSFATAFPLLKPGLFVTIARALELVETVDVRTYNNRIVPGKVLGYDVPSGLGVIQADVTGASPLEVSRHPGGEGDTSWAICYPVARSSGLVDYLPESYHRGRVTAAGQQGTNLVAFENLLRTDHTLEDGCLGSVLLDPYGAAAGMVLSAPDPGVVYAIPSSDLVSVVETLAEGKRPVRPYLGLGLVPPDDRRRVKFHLSPETSLPVVAYLIPSSPAQSAGVLAGDLLSGVGDEKIHDVAGAGARLLKSAPGGHPVRLTLIREGKEVILSISPIERPAHVLLTPSDELEETLQVNLAEVTTGPTSQRGLRLQQLVRGGRGEKDGYREGDVISTVNGKGAWDLELFNRIVRTDNSHIFGGKDAPEVRGRLSTYRIVMKVRKAETGEKVERSHMNLFPDVLSAPVY